MKRYSVLMALWAVLMLPFVWLLALSSQPETDLDAMVAATGNWAMAGLVVAVVMTPLAGVWRPLASRLWLRRAVGLAAFGGSIVHLAIYWLAMRSFAEPGGEWVLIADEALSPGILTGWLALLLLLPPALASNDAAMRRLRTIWKPVQRLAWLAAALALVHMAVVHDGYTSALAIAFLVAGVQLVRYFPVRSTRKAI